MFVIQRDHISTLRMWKLFIHEKLFIHIWWIIDIPSGWKMLVSDILKLWSGCVKSISRDPSRNIVCAWQHTKCNVIIYVFWNIGVFGGDAEIKVIIHHRLAVSAIWSLATVDRMLILRNIWPEKNIVYLHLLNPGRW